MRKCYETNNIKETIELGFQLGKLMLGKKWIVGLKGDLGAGKTTFVKGVAKALEIKDRIKSPTFVLLKEFRGRKGDLVHVDAYRLEGKRIDDIGLSDYFDRVNIIIEWYDLIAKVLPRLDVVVDFQSQEGDKRRICCDFLGKKRKK